MLTYAFDLLEKIYEKAGYAPREIPSLILKNNLYGIEIDTRAGELAVFALTMKAREYDSRFLRRENAPKPNICVLQNIHFEDYDFGNRQKDDGKLGPHFATLNKYDEHLLHDLYLFDKADCYGSLLTPEMPETKIEEAIKQFSEDVKQKQTILFNFPGQEQILCALKQLAYLSQRYHVVVTNPPYMGSKGLNADLKKISQLNYPDSKSDLFAMFIERGFNMIIDKGYSAMVTMQSWMFLSSYGKLRTKLLDTYTIECLAHMANMVMGIAFGTSATVWKKQYIPDYKGAFCFVKYEDIKNGKPKAFPPDNERNRTAERIQQ